MNNDNKVAFSHIRRMSLRTWEKLLEKYGEIVITWGQKGEVVARIVPPDEDVTKNDRAKKI